MKRYDVRIWEKAEHWYFDVTIAAPNLVAARQELMRDYPPRSYTITDIREHH